MEETLEEARGKNLLVRAADAEMTEMLWEQQEGSGQRDSTESEFEVECLLLDVAHESTWRQRSARRLWIWRSQVCSASGPRERPAPGVCGVVAERDWRGNCGARNGGRTQCLKSTSPTTAPLLTGKSGSTGIAWVDSTFVLGDTVGETLTVQGLASICRMWE